MKNLSYILLILIASTVISSCNQGEKDTSKAKQFTNSDKIDVIYFHFDRRCATCNAVENVTREFILANYKDKANFSVFNLDEQKGKETGLTLGINAQALVIIEGENKIDITNEAFMYARNNPEKLKEIIKEKIQSIE